MPCWVRYAPILSPRKRGKQCCVYTLDTVGPRYPYEHTELVLVCVCVCSVISQTSNRHFWRALYSSFCCRCSPFVADCCHCRSAAQQNVGFSLDTRYLPLLSYRMAAVCGTHTHTGAHTRTYVQIIIPITYLMKHIQSFVSPANSARSQANNYALLPCGYF